MNTAPTLDEASAAQTKALNDFVALCDMGRIVPLPLSKFVENRIAYTRACEALWDAHFRNIADTGVQVYRGR
jgi:hypothetical protein